MILRFSGSDSGRHGGLGPRRGRRGYSTFSRNPASRLYVYIYIYILEDCARSARASSSALRAGYSFKSSDSLIRSVCLVGGLLGGLLGCSVGWWVAWMVGWWVAWLVGCWMGWWVAWLVGCWLGWWVAWTLYEEKTFLNGTMLSR